MLSSYFDDMPVDEVDLGNLAASQILIQRKDDGFFVVKSTEELPDPETDGVVEFELEAGKVKDKQEISCCEKTPIGDFASNATRRMATPNWPASTTARSRCPPVPAAAE